MSSTIVSEESESEEEQENEEELLFRIGDSVDAWSARTVKVSEKGKNVYDVYLISTSTIQADKPTRSVSTFANDFLFLLQMEAQKVLGRHLNDGENVRLDLSGVPWFQKLKDTYGGAYPIIYKILKEQKSWNSRKAGDLFIHFMSFASNKSGNHLIFLCKQGRINIESPKDICNWWKKKSNEDFFKSHPVLNTFVYLSKMNMSLGLFAILPEIWFAAYVKPAAGYTKEDGFVCVRFALMKLQHLLEVGEKQKKRKFEVEKILKIDDGNVLVKWKKYTEPTWTQEDHVKELPIYQKFMETKNDPTYNKRKAREQSNKQIGSKRPQKTKNRDKRQKESDEMHINGTIERKYEVAHIEKVEKKKALVHWVGYTNPTWVPLKNVEHLDLYKDFKKRQKESDEMHINGTIERQYEVARIEKVEKKKVLVHWVGYTNPTWVPLKNVEHLDLYKDFKKSRSKKLLKRKRVIPESANSRPRKKLKKQNALKTKVDLEMHYRVYGEREAYEKALLVADDVSGRLKELETKYFHKKTMLNVGIPNRRNRQRELPIGPPLIDRYPKFLKRYEKVNSAEQKVALLQVLQSWNAQGFKFQGNKPWVLPEVKTETGDEFYILSTAPRTRHDTSETAVDLATGKDPFRNQRVDIDLIDGDLCGNYLEAFPPTKQKEKPKVKKEDDVTRVSKKEDDDISSDCSSDIEEDSSTT